MSSSTRRARPSVARRPARPQVGDYQRTRAAAGLAVFVLIFGCAWLLNGSFTADMVVRVFGADVLWGWAVHIGFSTVELLPIVLAPFIRTIPRPGQLMLWALSLPFGAFDVYSSAVGMSSWMQWTGATGLLQHAQNTGLGEVLAFLPEPMLLWLILLLHKTLRG